MRKHLHKFKKYWIEDASFLTLLFMLLVAVFIIPTVIEYSQSGVLMLNLILMSSFFIGIFSSDNKRLIALTTALFLAHLSLKVIRFTDNPYSFYVYENILACLNLAVFIVINFKLLFRDNKVGIYRIVGAINVYLLIGVLGAHLFEIIHYFFGDSLGGCAPLTGTDTDFATFIYFSFASMTTVGFGDVYAVNTAARMLAVFLSAVGMLYPAIIIARLVSIASMEKKEG
jgi:hypothetical protein